MAQQDVGDSAEDGKDSNIRTESAETGVRSRALFKIEPFTSGQIVQGVLAVSVGLGFLHLDVVAGGDPRLAVTVLRVSGYLPPIVSIIASLLPSVAWFALVQYWLYRMMGGIREGSAISFSEIALIGIALFIVVFLSTWWLSITACVLFGVVVLVGMYMRKSLRDKIARIAPSVEPTRVAAQVTALYMKPYRQLLPAFTIAMMLPIISTEVFSTQSWGVNELITTPTGAYTGMVLDQQDRWLVVLVHRPRYIMYIPVDDIRSRQMCRSSGRGRTLLQLVPGTTQPGGIQCG